MKSVYFRAIGYGINTLFVVLLFSCTQEVVIDRKLPNIPLNTPILMYLAGTQGCITYLPNQIHTAIQSECSGTGNLLFTVSKVGTEIYNIKSTVGNLCLEVKNGGLEDGSEIQFAACNGEKNQQVMFLEPNLDFKQVKISFVHSGKCLDVFEQSRLSGTPLNQWDCHTGPSQNILITPKRTDNAVLPRIIWSFWDNPATFPAFYKTNVEHWKAVLNDSDETWQIRVLNNIKGDENYFGNFVDEASLPTMDYLKSKIGTAPFEGKLNPAVVFSDFLRLELLYNHGGIWMDPSIMLHRDLSHTENALQILDGFSFAGFTTRHQASYSLRYADSLENWYFASLPKTEFMKVFKTNFRKYWDNKTAGMSVKDNPLFNGSSGPKIDITPFGGYEDPKTKTDVSFAEYLNQHVTLKYTIITNPKFLDQIFVIGGSDLNELGPFSLLQMVNWQDSKLVSLSQTEINSFVAKMLWVPMSKFPSENSRFIRGISALPDEPLSQTERRKTDEYFFDTTNIFGRLNAIPG